MKNLFTLAIVFASFSISAQQSTLIEYDYQTEEYTFYKVIKKKDTVIKKQIKKPYSYKGIPTKIVVKNLNTFYYDVAFKTEHKEVTPINGDENIETLSENFTSGYNAFTSMVGDVQGSDIYQSLFVDGEFQGLDGVMKIVKGMGASEFDQRMRQLEVMELQLEKTQSDVLLSSTENLKNIFDRIMLAEFVNNQLVKLQNNRDVSPVEMQARADELIKKILAKPSIESVISTSEADVKAIKKAYNDYKNGFTLYSQQHNALVSSISDLRTELDDAGLESTVQIFEVELKNDYDAIEANMDALETLLQEYNIGKIRQDYLEAFENYDKIMFADFDFEYSVNTDRDVTQLTMEFYESQAEESEEGETEIIKTRTLDIPTKGGLRINSSAGLSFLRFIEGQSTYNSNYGTVNEVAGDAFVPALTTMFHFYGQSPRPVSLGGAFGVSVPTEGDKEFIYMLGTSVIFGKSQRVILNLGAFGGKISRLDGMKVGDNITEGTIVPTKKIFDFGIYTGITFNINKLF